MVGSMGPMPGLPPSKGQTRLLPKSKFVLRAMDSPMHSTNDKRGSLKLAHKTRAAIQMLSHMKPDTNHGSPCDIGSHRKSLLPNLENPAKANPKPNSENISTPWGRKIKIDSRYSKPPEVTAQQGCNNSYQRSKTQEITDGNRIPTRNSICKPGVGVGQMDSRQSNVSGKNLPVVSNIDLSDAWENLDPGKSAISMLCQTQIASNQDIMKKINPDNADSSEDPGLDDKKIDADKMKQKEREKGKFT
jgi:type II secretory pathway pseudopilin PulG